IPRQRVQDAGGALTDDTGQELQIARRDDRADDLALGVVARRVHGDEVGQPVFLRLIQQRDAAQHGIGGIYLVAGIHLHDVAILRHRPERTVRAALRVVDRIVAPQPGKPVRPGIVMKDTRVARVDLVELYRPGIAWRGRTRLD